MGKVKVKSFLRNGKLVNSFLRSKKFRNAALGSTALVGVPTVAYAAVRQKYSSNIPKSAQMAKAKSLTVKVDDVPEDKKQITIVSGGFAGKSGKAGINLKKGLDASGFSNKTHIDVISNKEFDIKGGNGKETTPLQFVTQTNLKMLETTLKTGYNPVSVRMAATAYAYKRKYPDKDINLIGHSAGGLIASEASKILESMGVDVKVVTLGSPNFGYIRDKKDSLNLTSKQDVISKLPNRRKAKYINTVKGHQINDYLTDRNVKRELEDFFNKND